MNESKFSFALATLTLWTSCLLTSSGYVLNADPFLFSSLRKINTVVRLRAAHSVSSSQPPPVEKTTSSSSSSKNKNDAVAQSSSSVMTLQGEFTAKTFAASQCWGRRPLLIRNAFDPVQTQNEGFWPTQEDISILACDEDAESRIITHNPGDDSSYELQIGPFEEEDIDNLLCGADEREDGDDGHNDDDIPLLPKWTLLVNDVDRFLPSLADWIHSTFSFLPTWRRDDGQVSIAQTGGGIGSHVDSYDVFLVQTSGTREWRVVGDRKISEAEERERTMPDCNVRVLRTSSSGATQEREEVLVLRPGDCLYLPPRVLHSGTALTDDCMTLSVGCRAPSALDLVSKIAEGMTTDYNNNRKRVTTTTARYEDPQLLQKDVGITTTGSSSTATSTAKITDEAKRAARQLVKDAVLELIDDDDAWDRWFGSYVSEPKRLRTDYPMSLLEEDQEWLDDLGVWGNTTQAVASVVLTGKGVLRQAEGITFCYSELNERRMQHSNLLTENQMLPHSRLFVNGLSWDIINPSVPVDLIANERLISQQTFQGKDVCAETISLLEDLVERGLLYGSDD